MIAVQQPIACHDVPTAKNGYSRLANMILDTTFSDDGVPEAASDGSLAAGGGTFDVDSSGVSWLDSAWTEGRLGIC
jgi:hypothetical protein